MNLRKLVPWLDFVMLGSLSLLSIILLLFVLAVHKDLGGMIVTGAMTFGFVLIFVIVLVRWFLSKPDFYTEQGTAIWTGGITQITSGLMTRALNHYINELSNRFPKIRKDLVNSVITKAAIEWSATPVGAMSTGWVMSNKAGLRLGYDIKVHWKGSVSSSAFFHELHHMANEYVMKKALDYNHEDAEWWEIEKQIRSKFYE